MVYSLGIDFSLISTFHKFKYKFYLMKNYKKDFIKILKIAWHLDFCWFTFILSIMKLAKLASKNKSNIIW